MLEIEKSVIVNRIDLELKDIINSLIVKKQYMADRYETLETRQQGDAYIAVINRVDSFYSYPHYSDYALNKAGLYEDMYKFDKTNIPMDKRDEVVAYQREFILATFNEGNNYYRMLAGLPDIEDEDFIYLNEPIDGVDITKPIHEMDEDDITILSVLGKIDELKKLYPNKRYLDHLTEDRRIPVNVSRHARDFKILAIKKDRNKQGVSDKFIALYNETRNYVIARFKDESFSRYSEYYDGFIGIFILSITCQRYITDYYNNIINRDFFDKDIIQMFFESYDIPFYDKIPLSYLQKVAKNLNLLIRNKGIDKVFVDIFKIFDLDNIDIFNYILFKDRLYQADGQPVNIYREKTELGYWLDTETYEGIISNEFSGLKVKNVENVKQIIIKDEFGKDGKPAIFRLLNNGILELENFDKTKVFNNKITETFTEATINADVLMFKLDKDIKFLQESLTGIHIICRSNKVYMIDTTSFTTTTIPCIELKKKNNKVVKDIIYKTNINKKFTLGIGINYYDKTSEIIYYDGLFNLDFINHNIGEFDNTEITYLDVYDGAIVINTNNGTVYGYGKANDGRFLYPDQDEFYGELCDISSHISRVKRCVIMEHGMIFIMKDGDIRWTGEIPEFNLHKTSIAEHELSDKFHSVKKIERLNDGTKNFYISSEYNDTATIFNYSFTDKFGPLLFRQDIINPTIKFKFVRDIFIYKNTMLITVAQSESKISFAGQNESQYYPFIKTFSLIDEPNVLNIKHIEYVDPYMYFVTKDNKLFRFEGKDESPKEIFDFIKINESVQDIVSFTSKIMSNLHGLMIYVGKPYVYLITNEEVKKINIRYNGNNIIPLHSYTMGSSNACCSMCVNALNPSEKFDIRSDILYFKDNENYDLIPGGDEWYSGFDPINKYLIDFSNNKYRDQIQCTFSHFIPYQDRLVPEYMTSVDITVLDDIFIDAFLIDKRTVIIVGKNHVQCCRLPEDILSSDFEQNGRIIDTFTLDILEKNRTRIDKVNDELVCYSRKGGIILTRFFMHMDKLDVEPETDFIELYNDIHNNIVDFAFSDYDVMRILDVNKQVTFEPVVEEMYDLKFITAPINTKNLESCLVNRDNYLDYTLVVDDDKLWGGKGDKGKFIKEILESEFNYVYSKYISVNSRYDLATLNFEVCYMFKMLVDLKDNEKYLDLDLPYVGSTNLFDAIVGLFALTCIKFGFGGNIPDTTTKAMSVLGFNFGQDMDYLTRVVEEAKLYKRDPKFKKEDIEIFKAPKLFKNPSEVINLYLDNRDILENILDYKWNAKTIQEYNAYKRIEDETLYAKYSTDMYRIDGVLPKTYMDYLQAKNPKLHQLITETNDENLVQQIDLILVSLDEYLKTDKLKHLFLNIPSLSMDNIRQFIYYLIDVFKSYTVDLAGLNIIYHVDDKRLNNIKLVLSEDNFFKYFEDYTNIALEDFFDNVFSVFELYDEIKLRMFADLDAHLTLEDWLILFQMFDSIDLIAEDIKTENILSDFRDLFTTMDESEDLKTKLLLQIKTNPTSVLIPMIKHLIKSDSFQLLISLLNEDEVKLTCKGIREGKFEDGSTEVFKNIKDYLSNLLKERTEKTKLDYKDELELKIGTAIAKDIIPFDLTDKINYGISSVQQYTNIKIKDKFYFERKEN